MSGKDGVAPDGRERAVRVSYAEEMRRHRAMECPATYDHERNEWNPRCPHGDICSGCDAAGFCERAADALGRGAADGESAEIRAWCRLTLDALTAPNTEPAPAGDHSSSSVAEPGKGKAEAGVGLTASVAEQLEERRIVRRGGLWVRAVGEAVISTHARRDEAEAVEATVRQMEERHATEPASAGDHSDLPGGLSVEKQLRAVVAAAEWQRECDTPAVVGDSRAHAALIDAMDALYGALDALASVGVRPEDQEEVGR